MAGWRRCRDDVAARIGGYGSLGKVPAAATPNLRNDMYLVLDTTKLVAADKAAQTPLHRAGDRGAEGAIRPSSNRARATFRSG